ncbi:Gfo/Idh/MocA family oxidoreductase [Arthrobacter sp. StoSoilB20]|uniref:Gfo/Idh/MocA family protein n=1 Tax=Arthrobacter sp. StoSoilB20 TaxID=2830995 RepID=UPI001CC4BF50|nr:Gfo/Idh/MocA family oxidoreductase [Arthrobacter sp. StoSoilB20]
MSAVEQQETTAPPPLGVGILGAGPVTQAIHLPTLARLTHTFFVAHVMDVDAGIAESVAGRVGARFSTSVQKLLADPEVEVVVICSPHQFHAEQVIAACRAGKRAILCEKPFAMSGEEAARISEVSTETGVPIIVGAMHTFDPGWKAAEEAWGDLADTAHTLRSSIVLPPNPRFEDFATEVINRPVTPPAAPDLRDPTVLENSIRGGVMGLAIHDLPLVRRFVPSFTDLEVLCAEALEPFGYLILAQADGRNVDLQAVMSDSWEPEWTFEAFSDTKSLRVTFTPSYVQAGSAVAEISDGEKTQVFGPFDANGYEAEWQFLALLARGEASPPSADTLIQDLQFALAIADAAASAALKRQEAAA